MREKQVVHPDSRVSPLFIYFAHLVDVSNGVFNCVFLRDVTVLSLVLLLKQWPVELPIVEQLVDILGSERGNALIGNCVLLVLVDLKLPECVQEGLSVDELVLFELWGNFLDEEGNDVEVEIMEGPEKDLDHIERAVKVCGLLLQNIEEIVCLGVVLVDEVTAEGKEERGRELFFSELLQHMLLKHFSLLPLSELSLEVIEGLQHSIDLLQVYLVVGHREKLLQLEVGQS